MTLGSMTLGIGILGTIADGTAAGMEDGMEDGAGMAIHITIITTGTTTSVMALLPEYIRLEIMLRALHLALA